MVLYALLAVIVIAGLFLLAVFVLPRGEEISAPTPDTRPWDALPERRLRPEDVIATRLPVALRGYRFAETDLLLDRLTEEIRERDEEIARLSGRQPADESSRQDGSDYPAAPAGDESTPHEDGHPAPRPHDGTGQQADDRYRAARASEDVHDS